MAQELSAAVVIMDVTMPGLNGIDATRQLKAEAPDVKVIGLSMHPERQFVLEMLSVGASGYLLKDCPFAELVQAIGAAVAGDVYLSPKVAGVVVRGRGTNSAHGGLTPREREVLQQVAEGKNTKEIARDLRVSRNTVRKVRRTGETSFEYERTVQPRPKLGQIAPQPVWVTGPRHGSPRATTTQATPRRLHSRQTA